MGSGTHTKGERDRGAEKKLGHPERGPAAQLRGGYPGRDKLGPSVLELHCLDLRAERIL